MKGVSYNTLILVKVLLRSATLLNRTAEVCLPYTSIGKSGPKLTPQKRRAIAVFEKRTYRP